MSVYLDTSALLKRYLPERNSDSFEAYFRDIESALISRLTLVELRSTLARKRREGRFDASKEAEVLIEISTDIQDGLLTVSPAIDIHFVAAFHMIGRLASVALAHAGCPSSGNCTNARKPTPLPQPTTPCAAPPKHSVSPSFTSAIDFTLPTQTMNNETSAPALDENQIIIERRAKLAAIREQGVAFPNDFERRDYAGELAAAHGDKSKEALEAEAVPVQLAGRMMLKRVMGKASFATLQDMSGRIQVYMSQRLTGVEAHDAFKHWDLGDFHRRDRHPVQDQQGRADHPGEVDPPADQGAAPAAGKIPWPHRPGAEIPPALPRPHHQRRTRARPSCAARRSSRPFAPSWSSATFSKSKRR